MKKLIALLTLSTLPVLGLAGIAHADEDHGTPPVNPHITHLVVHGGGACTPDPSSNGDECGAVAPVNPTIDHVVVRHGGCPAGGADPECNGPVADPEMATVVAPAAQAARPTQHKAAPHKAASPLTQPVEVDWFVIGS